MDKQHFCYLVVGSLALKIVILPDWPTTVALIFGIILCGFWMWLDSKAVTDKSHEIDTIKDEVSKVSDRLSALSLKIGFKK